jgi:beta-galactosidase
MMESSQKVRLGSSYYPERWDRQRWPIDADLMKELGFDFIRTGEFAWSKLEPADGQFAFEWMDDAIELFANQGIKTILCTPTASPMPWMYDKHPGMIPITEEGKPFGPGERRHYCFNNPDFRYYADRITTRMAEHYAANPNIIAWQIDNELGGEEFICYCPYCKVAFQEWARNKYKTVEELNRRWGGTFFSLEFINWSEVPLPIGHNVNFFNPTMKKDYLHFYSDSMRDFLLSQYRILKQQVGDIPVTTNRFTVFWTDKYDHDMDSAMDVVSFDNYDLELSMAAFHHDLYRSIKPSVKHWVLEQHTGLRDFGANGRDIISQTVQSIVRGAEVVCYFSWRQINYGVEQDFYGVVEHDGSVGETYEILKSVVQWVKDEGAFMVDLTVKNDVAIFHSFDSSMMYYVNHMFSAVNYHRTLYEQFYIPLFELGVGIDFIRDFADMYRYRAVIIPLHILENQEGLRQIEAYVASGGIVYVTGEFMHKSEDNWRVYGETIDRINVLSGLGHQKLLFVPKESKETYTFDYQGKSYTYDGYFNKAILENTASATVLAEVSEPAFERGTPAVTECQHGEGRFVMIHTLPEASFMKQLFADELRAIGIERWELPNQVECMRLHCRDGELAGYFIINQSADSFVFECKEQAEPIRVSAGTFQWLPVDSEGDKTS